MDSMDIAEKVCFDLLGVLEAINWLFGLLREACGGGAYIVPDFLLEQVFLSVTVSDQHRRWPGFEITTHNAPTFRPLVSGPVVDPAFRISTSSAPPVTPSTSLAAVANITGSARSVTTMWILPRSFARSWSGPAVERLRMSAITVLDGLEESCETNPRPMPRVAPVTR